MKVAFLNCTDELNPEAGSELTCVFLDKIPGTLEATCCPDCKMRMRTISAARKDEHDYVKSVGTTMTMKNGSKATCIAYHGVNNITVEFEDGFVLYHARWNQFVRGALHHNQKNINE